MSITGCVSRETSLLVSGMRWGRRRLHDQLLFIAVAGERADFTVGSVAEDIRTIENI